MSQITTPPTTPAPHPVAPALESAPVRTPKPLGPWQCVRKYVLGPIASLRLTVVVFSLALFLVFAGTLGQAESGNLTVINQYFRTFGFVWIPGQVFVRFGQVFLGLPADLQAHWGFYYPGGWLLGAVLLTNLLVAHGIRFRFAWQDLFLLPAFVLSVFLLVMSELHHSNELLMWSGLIVLTGGLCGLIPLHGKKSGVLVLHLGLIVMMVSEFITGVYAVEGTMTMANGETANFIDNNHETELAFIERSDPKTDNVVAIPQSFLRRGEPIRTDLLPFEIVVKKFLVNSIVGKIQQGEQEDNPATVGDGQQLIALEKNESSGTEGEVDVASAYITLKRRDNGKALGTYLVSLWFSSNFTRRQLPDRPQTVEVDGKEYHFYLRAKRSYRPFSLHLIEFRHDRFAGTNTARNFSSDVRLVDPRPEENVDRVMKIWMNHPLRYSGETFYQQAFLPDDAGTVLQVVRNPGWLMPYVSCAMVSLGMLIHFGLHLFGFLRRRAVA